MIPNFLHLQSKRSAGTRCLCMCRPGGINKNNVGTLFNGQVFVLFSIFELPRTFSLKKYTNLCVTLHTLLRVPWFLTFFFLIPHNLFFFFYIYQYLISLLCCLSNLRNSLANIQTMYVSFCVSWSSFGFVIVTEIWYLSNTVSKRVSTMGLLNMSILPQLKKP